jgi:predicted amidophosphoribosyltransferase
MGVGSQERCCVNCGKPLPQSDATRCRRCYQKNGGANELIRNQVSPWRTMPDGVMQRFVGDLPQRRDVRSR